jgi:hypothetical protein
MLRLEDVRAVRWFDDRLQVEGESGLLESVAVAARDLVVVGVRIRPGLRYLAVRLPAGSAVMIERRGRRTAVAVSAKKAG